MQQPETKDIKRRLSTSTASSGFESRKVSIESSSSSMSASTVATEEEDIEEESAVTRVKSDQHLEQLLTGELDRNCGQYLVLHRFLLRSGRVPTLRDKHRSQLVSSLSQVDILKALIASARSIFHRTMNLYVSDNDPY